MTDHKSPVDATGLGDQGVRPGPLCPKTSTGGPRLVGCRVDALVVALKVDLSSALRDEVAERQAIADEVGKSELRLAGLPFAMRRSRRRDAVSFENADVRAAFDERASGGWRLEIIIRATYLATHPIEEAMALAERIAKGLGTVVADRIRRFDLAVDFTAFPLERGDVDRLVTTRARLTSFIEDTKDVDEVGGACCKPRAREFRAPNGAVTGFAVAPGNALMARIYDKTQELALNGREEKRDVEHANWGEAGWDGSSQVTRVEFQHRNRALDELSTRDPHDLSTRLDPVWQHDVRWLRMVDPNSATRLSRCDLDPRWQVVCAVTFLHTAQPAKRVRARGGATPQHVLGTMRSRLAASGKLRRIELGVTDDGEVLNEVSYAERMTAPEAARWVREYVKATHELSSDDMAADLLRRDSPQKVAARLAATNNAAVARFSSVDDADPPESTGHGGR